MMTSATWYEKGGITEAHLKILNNFGLLLSTVGGPPSFTLMR